MTDISTVTNITGAEVSSETIGAIDIMNAFGYSYSCHHYLCYLIADSFLENVLLLQRWYKRRLFRNSLNYRIHEKKYLKCMRDIFEYGMTPPIITIPLLRRGGHLYRESLHEFECNRLHLKNKEVIIR